MERKEMNRQLDKIEKRVDRICYTLNDVQIELAKNTADLKQHMKRTALLEKKVVYSNAKDVIIVLAIISLVAKFLGLV